MTVLLQKSIQLCDSLNDKKEYKKEAMKKVYPIVINFL